MIQKLLIGSDLLNRTKIGLNNTSLHPLKEHASSRLQQSCVTLHAGAKILITWALLISLKISTRAMSLVLLITIPKTPVLCRFNKFAFDTNQWARWLVFWLCAFPISIILPLISIALNFLFVWMWNNSTLLDSFERHFSSLQNRSFASSPNKHAINNKSILIFIVDYFLIFNLRGTGTWRSLE